MEVNLKCDCCKTESRVVIPDGYDMSAGPPRFAVDCFKEINDAKFTISIEVTDCDGYICPKCVAVGLAHSAARLAYDSGDLCAGVGFETEEECSQ